MSSLSRLAESVRLAPAGNGGVREGSGATFSANWGMGERRAAGALRMVETDWGSARWSQAAIIAP